MKCSEKTKYATKSIARTVGERRQEETQRKLKLYLCKECGFWHLTHWIDHKRSAIVFQVDPERIVYVWRKGGGLKMIEKMVGRGSINKTNLTQAIAAITEDPSIPNLWKDVELPLMFQLVKKAGWT